MKLKPGDKILLIKDAEYPIYDNTAWKIISQSTEDSFNIENNTNKEYVLYKDTDKYIKISNKLYNFYKKLGAA